MGHTMVSNVLSGKHSSSKNSADMSVANLFIIPTLHLEIGLYGFRIEN